MNAKVQKITVTEPIENEDGTYTVTVANLDDLVRSFRNKLKDKRYRNLPNPKDKALRMEVDIFSAQYVKFRSVDGKNEPSGQYYGICTTLKKTAVV